MCTGLHPSPEVENNAFLLEATGSPLNHLVVTGDPNTSSGWGCGEKKRSNPSVGKGNPKSSRLGWFCSYPCGPRRSLSTNKHHFPKPLPRGPWQEQPNLCRSWSQTSAEEKVAQHSSWPVVLRAQHHPSDAKLWLPTTLQPSRLHRQ